MTSPGTSGQAESPSAIVRVAEPELATLLTTLFRRYPRFEWATFARFGWRETERGLVLTLASLDLPELGDLDDRVGHVVIHEPYSLRIALTAETHPLGVGVVHSHPEGYHTGPSHIDDDMDGYYSTYFSDFAPGRPYVSLIFARSKEGDLSGTGRIFYRGKWTRVERFALDRKPIRLDRDGSRQKGSHERKPNWGTVARLASAFGAQAAARLADATVAVVGASGTGSPALEILARAGVGHLIAVDPDTFSESNLERVHGSAFVDVPKAGSEGPLKIAIATRHLKSINPKVRVTAVNGRVPQSAVVDALVAADVVLGCTDKHHSRLALSDLAVRYLVPVIDCGVSLEGSEGNVQGQVIQLARLLPEDPCALCRKMIDPVRVTQELMSEEERNQRRRAAALAEARGEEPGGYWREEPQLNTVGYLTTIAGALAAAYTIGWIAGRFDAPFGHLQMNISAPFFDVTDSLPRPRSDCSCRRVRGFADQAEADALVTAPMHWPAPVIEAS